MWLNTLGTYNEQSTGVPRLRLHIHLCSIILLVLTHVPVSFSLASISLCEEELVDFCVSHGRLYWLKLASFILILFGLACACHTVAGLISVYIRQK